MRSGQNLDVEALFSLTTDVMCVCSFAGVLDRINSRWLDVLGYQRENLIGKPLAKMMHADDAKIMQQQFARLQAGERPDDQLESRMRHVDGSYRWFIWKWRLVDKSLYMAGRDITTLKARDELNDDIQKSGLIGGWTLNLSKSEVMFTAETYRIYELPIGQKVSFEDGIRYYHPEDRLRVAQHVERCISTCESFDIECRLITAKGKHIWVRGIGHRVDDADGRAVEVRGTFQDITQRKLMEMQHLDPLVQFDRVMANTNGMIYRSVFDANGNNTYPFVSNHVQAIFEFSAKELQANPRLLEDAIFLEDRQASAEGWTAAFANLTQFFWTGRIRTKSGKIKWIKINCVPEKLSDGVIQWDGCIFDVSKERAMEQELTEQRKVALHVARLAEIGQLAAGVGHEINNPLAIAIGKLEMLKAQVVAGPDAEAKTGRNIEQISQAHLRIKKIVDGLRTFATMSTNTEDRGDLIVAVTSTLGLVSELFSKESIRIDTDFGDQSNLIVGCDLGRLQQIIMNFLTNARDATAGIAQRRILIATSTTDGKAQIRISDNGCGMDDKVKAKIFENFYTTKKAGQGTGLGLSITQSIVTASGGHIDVESAPGAGTTFIVTLPLATTAGKSEPAAELTRSVVSMRPRTALIVDDEPALREIFADYLATFNFMVRFAGDGQEAFDILKQQTFDFLFTDAKMPGMDGIQLLTLAHKNQLLTNTWSILVTGGVSDDYASTLKIGEGDDSLCDGYLSKPFAVKQLVDLVNSLLAEDGPTALVS